MQTAYHKTIAALCWELVYHRLAQGALRQHWLETARRHMESALHTSGLSRAHLTLTTLTPSFCMGASCWSYESWKEAKTAFGRAHTDGHLRTENSSLACKIAFEQCRYDEVKRRFVRAQSNR